MDYKCEGFQVRALSNLTGSLILVKLLQGVIFKDSHGHL